MKIQDIFKKYHGKLDRLDLELLVAHSIKKTREFVLAHPEFSVNSKQEAKINAFIKRRLKNEPVAYILGQKEFYGLPFKVNKATLIPRPETELLVERALQKIQETPSSRAKLATGQERDKKQEISIIDLGTGSGNIIIALAHNAKRETRNEINFYGIDISSQALKIAKQNAKVNKVDKKIKFTKSNLLKYFLDHCSLFTGNFIILANLPYLSKKIYNETMPDVKKFEPRSALLSGQDGLNHYRRLLAQIKKLKEKYFLPQVLCFMEISPEQKNSLHKIIKNFFPQTEIKFHRDLAGKWRVLEIKFPKASL